MNKNNFKKNDEIEESSKYDFDKSEEKLSFKEYISYPEESILLDINLSLSLWELSIKALNKIIKDRNLQKELTIKKQNKYKNTLNINDLNIQIALCGLGSDEVEIPLKIWQGIDNAPQIILVAQIDDENNIIHFPGILTGSKFINQLNENSLNKESITMQISDFEGGIDILFSYVKFFNKASLPRTGLRKKFKVTHSNNRNGISLTLILIFIGGLILGRNIINPKIALENKNELNKKLESQIALENKNKLNKKLESQIALENKNKTPVDDFNLANKCSYNNFSKITTNMFVALNNDKYINILDLECKSIININKNIYNSFLTTGRLKGNSVICLSDDKENDPCRFVIGKFVGNISPSVALAKATGFEIPKAKFLNETSSRIFINISEVFGK